MNGPFELQGWNAGVLDASGNEVATGRGVDEADELKNAEMICAALNAAYYTAKATGSPT